MKTVALDSFWSRTCCVLVICFSSALAAPEQWHRHRPKILGGQEAQRGAWPWMTALVARDATNFHDDLICAGALVSPYWVVTAGHCVDGEGPLTLDVVVGLHNLQTDILYQRRHVREIIRHPAIDRNAEFDSDIALLLLDQPVTNIAPLEIIDEPALAAPGGSATILGWGATNSDETVYPVALHAAQVPIVSLEVANAPAAHDGTLTANMIPAGFAQGGVDSCLGDSGGPLVVRSVDGQRWMLAGITSFGKADQPCGTPNNYGVYTRVSSFRNWLYTFMRPSYGAWEGVHAVSGETRDPDGDGASNRLEFIRGTSPNNGQETGAESVSIVTMNADQVPVFTFRRRAATPEINYSALVSVNGFSAWQVLDPATQLVGPPTPVPGAPGLEEVALRAPGSIAPPNTAAFFRLTATAVNQFVRRIREIEFPGFVSHALHDLDAVDGNSFVKNYLLRGLDAVEGPVVLNLRSSAFDAVLRLYNAATRELLATSNANNAGGTNELLTFTPQATTDYLVAVTSAEPQRNGDFLLAAYQSPAGLPTLAPNSPQQGSLTTQDPPNPLAGIPNVFKDDYVPTGATEMQQVTVTMTSNAFAPFVHIIDVATGQSAFEGSVAANESVVSFLWPADRSLLVRATSQNSDAVGNYTIQMNVRTVLTLTPSQQRNGALTTTDDRDPDFLPDVYYLDSYLLVGATAGQVINVQATSTAIDCYLYVIDADTRELVAENDDISTTNFNSQLNFIARAGVTYIIQVSSAFTEEVGNYTVRTF